MDIIYGFDPIKHKYEDMNNSQTITHRSIYNMMFVFQSVFIIVVGLMIRNFVNGDGYYVLLVILFPVIMVTYSTWVHVNSNKTDAELLKQLNNEIVSEQTPHIIPILLFSLGIIMQSVHHKNAKIMLKYMLWAVVFGTIGPVLLNQTLFDYQNLHRMIIFAEIEFALMSIAIGFMLLSISMLL